MWRQTSDLSALRCNWGKKNPELIEFRARLELATYRYMHFAICRSTAELPEPDLEEVSTESRI